MFDLLSYITPYSAVFLQNEGLVSDLKINYLFNNLTFSSVFYFSYK